MPRAMLAHDLCAALGWLDAAQYVEAFQADVQELCRFHAPGYIAALARAEAEQTLPEEIRLRTRIGVDGNVIHKAVFRRPATSAGGALLTAAYLAQGMTVYAPGTGNHHGQPGRASGFCFVNDIALGILRLRALGFTRIAYIDLDAHHGDGVEQAFATDAEVLTLSVHEAGRWPRTGLGHDRAHAVYNFPVPPGFNDSELDFLLTAAILPALETFQPEVVLVLPGADALADDKMSRLALSNNALMEAVARLKAVAPRLAVFGGGGYNPFALGRCWAGIWAVLNDQKVPEILPQAAQDVLAPLRYERLGAKPVPAHWLTTLRDPPLAGPVRDAVKFLAEG